MVSAYRDPDRAAGKRKLQQLIDSVSDAVPAALIEVRTLGRTLKKRAADISRRGDTEVAFLMQVIEDLVAARLTQQTVTWQIHIAGMLDVLPATTASALKLAAEQTRSCATGAHLTLAVGYGGRQDILEAVRELLQERSDDGATPADVARSLTTDDIARHLDTADRPDPDLIIRTSGEQRMSNFLLWQATGAELYFCETYWPAFRELDFLRALRTFAARKQRHP